MPMDEDERDFSDIDPAKLLPFECWLEPEDISIEHLPPQYQGTSQVVYGGENYI